MVDADWADTFFDGLWLDYQRSAWDEEQTAEDADVIEALMELPEGAPLLDVPCGEGRLSLALARRGYAVTGVDRAAPLLDDARAVARSESLPAVFDRGDMTRLAYDAVFDGALCWWGSLGYGDTADDRETLAGIARSLRPGGIFVLDTHVMETVLPHFEPRGFAEHDGLIVTEERAFNHETGRVDTRWNFVAPDGRRETKESALRLYPYRELAGLLVDAGFTDLIPLSPVDLTPFETGDPRLVIRAVRG
jgi:SAM-dependent methyltransferase